MNNFIYNLIRAKKMEYHKEIGDSSVENKHCGLKDNFQIVGLATHSPDGLPAVASDRGDILVTVSNDNPKGSSSFSPNTNASNKKTKHCHRNGQDR